MLLNENLFNIEGSYGGQQSWLKSFMVKNQFWADRSCGVTAAANLIMYLSRSDDNLYQLYQGTSKEDFVELMRELYPFLKPRVYGIPTLSKMKRGILGYANSKGVRLRCEMESWIWDVDEGSNFVVRVLEKNRPVLLLTWNATNREFRNHWITVTGIMQIDHDLEMTASNWGIRRTYSYKGWIKDKALLRGAISFYWDEK